MRLGRLGQVGVYVTVGVGEKGHPSEKGVIWESCALQRLGGKMVLIAASFLDSDDECCL